MSVVTWLIISSFVLVLAGITLMALSHLAKQPVAALVKAHYAVGMLAGLVYALAAFLVLLDGRPWGQFKSELVFLLGIFALTYVSAYFGKKGQRLLHYLMIFILAITIAVLHL
ncbi:MAG: hypothetical protein WCT37_05370, partial [Patescibacteria group bacterium]